LLRSGCGSMLTTNASVPLDHDFLSFYEEVRELVGGKLCFGIVEFCFLTGSQETQFLVRVQGRKPLQKNPFSKSKLCLR